MYTSLYAVWFIAQDGWVGYLFYHQVLYCMYQDRLCIGMGCLLGWAVYRDGLFIGMGCVSGWVVYWDGLCIGMGCLLGWAVYRDGLFVGMSHILGWVAYISIFPPPPLSHLPHLPCGYTQEMYAECEGQEAPEDYLAFEAQRNNEDDEQENYEAMTADQPLDLYEEPGIPIYLLVDDVMMMSLCFVCMQCKVCCLRPLVPHHTHPSHTHPPSPLRPARMDSRNCTKSRPCPPLPLPEATPQLRPSPPRTVAPEQCMLVPTLCLEPRPMRRRQSGCTMR